MKKGKNEHFRVFGVDTPSSSATAGPKISELARAPFFTTPSPPAATLDDTYQRIVRVSAPFSDGQGSTLPQLGACATGLSKHPQIAIFDVTSAAPAATAPSAKSNSAAAVLPKVRGVLDLSKDAADIDVIQTGADQYQLAYCTDYELFLFNVSTSTGSKRRSSSGTGAAAVVLSTVPGTPVPVALAAAAGSSDEPYLAYEITKDENTGAPRPTFRSIRYVTPSFVLAVCNLPKRSGAFLLGLRLPDISVPNSTAQARININVKLPRAVSQATGLAVRGLSPPSAPGARLATGSQFVAAVAGAGADNISLSLYTFEYQTDGRRTEMLAKLHPFRFIKNVHEQPMTCVALSHFTPPASASTTSTSSSSSTPPYLRVASVSVKNTVVVQYVPLRKLPAPATSSSSSPVAAAALNTPRYVVALKSQAPSGTSFTIFAVLVFVISSLIAQGIMEILGVSQPLLGARQVVPITWLQPLPSRYAAYDRLAKANSIIDTITDIPIAEVTQVVEKTERVDPLETPDFGAMPEIHPVAAFLSSASEAPADAAAQQVLFLRGEDSDHTIEIAAHSEEEHGPAVPWEKLDEAQQAMWRQKLEQAGHWTEDMGETVFRGVLFGELAGIVGAFVR